MSETADKSPCAPILPKCGASPTSTRSHVASSLSEIARAPSRGGATVRITLFGSYTCALTRSMWRLVEALESALGSRVDLRFGHVLGAADSVTALRLAEAAEAACGQDCFGRMHAWLMAHPECHEGAEAAEWRTRPDSTSRGFARTCGVQSDACNLRVG
jgi:hypothetical protein